MSSTTKLGSVAAAEKILRQNEGGPMPLKALCEQAAKIATAVKGKTPEATISAQVYLAAKRGEKFSIPAKGQVALLATSEPQPVRDADEPVSPIKGAVVVRQGKTVTPDPKPQSTKKQGRSRAKTAA